MDLLDITKQESLETAGKTFREFLAKKKMRVTNQRLAIFDAAVKMSDHFTAEELLEVARKVDRDVSRATVYRTLPILVEAGLAKEIDVGLDYKFYAASLENTNEQAQVVCVDCDKIQEVEAPFLEWYGNTVAGNLGLRVVSQRLQVHAHCVRLAEEGSCANKTH